MTATFIQNVVVTNLTIVDGIPTTTSNDVAKHFCKRHSDVIRAIRQLDTPVDFTERNFALSEFTDSTGRKLPAYRITRDGFTLLAMGFTGKEALRWKLAYLTAFNAMESALQSSRLSATTKYIEPGLDDLDCRQLEGVINHLRSRHDFQAPALREAVLSRFGAQSFAHIPKSRFQDAINVLREYAPGASASQVPARAFVAQAGNQITITIN